MTPTTAAVPYAGFTPRVGIEMMRPNVPATLAGGRVRTLRHAEEQRSPVKKKKKTIFTDRIEEYFQ